MKKFLAFFALITLLACENSVVDINKQSAPSQNNLISYEDQIGKFVNDHIQLHMNYDPFNYAKPEYRDGLKALFKELESGTDEDIVWEKAIKAGKSSRRAVSLLKQNNIEIKNYLARKERHDVKNIDDWFVERIAYTEARTDLTDSEKNDLIIHQTTMRYGIRASLETLIASKTIKNGRSSSDDDCAVKLADCYLGNISTFAGIGSVFTPDKITGGVIGIFAGAIYSAFVCRCEEACTFARAVYTDDVCYNGSSITFRAKNYGSNPNGFRWAVYSSEDMNSGTQLMNQYGPSDGTFNIPNSVIQQANQVIYVANFTLCDGIEKSPGKLIECRVYNLGKPNYYISGPTTVRGNDISEYYPVGRNYGQINWYVGSYSGATWNTLAQTGSFLRLRWGFPPSGNSSANAFISTNTNSSCLPGGASIYVNITQ